MKARALRPFLPARDFAQSRRFYAALGFVEAGGDAGVVVLERDGLGFLLQDYFAAGWAENAMVQLVVEDLAAWFAATEALDLPGRFGVAPPSPPQRQDWGGLVSHLVDPSGVLWHVTQLPG